VTAGRGAAGQQSCLIGSVSTSRRKSGQESRTDFKHKLFFTILSMDILRWIYGVIAILVGVVALFLFRKAAALKEKRNRFIVLLVGLAVINLTASNLLSISEYLHQKLHISVHIEEIMLGRHAIAVEMAHDIDSRPLVKSLIGYGPGSANALATLVSDGTLKEPHNDWLKILYDYGILGSIIITVFIALVFSSSTTGAVIALTNAIMMTADNVVIYLYYQFPIVLMLAYSVMRESRASETANAPEAKLIKATQG